MSEELERSRQMSSEPDNASARAEKRAIVVIGSHRSGTSAVARCLSLMGAALPRFVMPAASSNPKGHWEPQPIVNLNDEILARYNARWDDPDRLPADAPDERHARAYRPRARDLIRREYGDKPLIVLKDPRISLLTGFWKQALDDEGYASTWLVMVRRPEEVVASLAARNTMPDEQAIRLWAWYMARADIGTVGLDRVFCTYHDLVEQPEATLRGLSGRLFPEQPSELARDAAQAFLDTRHRHHHGEQDESACGLSGPLLALRAHGIGLARDGNRSAEPSLAALDYLAHSRPAPSVPRDATDSRTVRSEDVHGCYRLLLGRNPENEQVIAERLGTRLDDLVRGCLMGQEFRDGVVLPALDQSIARVSDVDTGRFDLGAWATTMLGIEDVVVSGGRRIDILANLLETEAFVTRFAIPAMDWSFQDVAAGLRGHLIRRDARDAEPGPDGRTRFETIRHVRVDHGREVALLLARSDTGAVLPHVADHANQLRNSGIAVILIVSSANPVRLSPHLMAHLDGALVLGPGVSDFPVWGAVLDRYPHLLGASTLYLVDDTIVCTQAPGSYERMIKAVRASAADLVGLTASFAGGWHVDSYFQALRPRVLSLDRLADVFAASPVGAADDDCPRCAHRLAEMVEASGLAIELIHDGGEAVDPSRTGWSALVDRDYPFVRTSSLRDGGATAFVDAQATLLDAHGFDRAMLLRIGAALDERIAPVAGGGLSAHPAPPISPPYRVAVHAGVQGLQDLVLRTLLAALRRSGASVNLHPAGPASGDVAATASTDFTGDADVAIWYVADDGDDVSERRREAMMRAGRCILCHVGGAVPPHAGLRIDGFWQSPELSPAKPWDGMAETLPVDPAALADGALDRFVAESLRRIAIAPRRAMRAVDPDASINGIAVTAPGTLEGLYVLPLDRHGAPLPDEPGPSAWAGYEWIVLAPLGSELAPGIGRLVRGHAARDPDADIFYADDVAVETMHAVDAIRLKPAFDPILLAAQDYVGAPLFVRSTAWIALGGLDGAMKTAAMADLLFRAADAGQRIVHIPIVALRHPEERVTADPVDHAAMLRSRPSLAGYEITQGAMPRTFAVTRRFGDAAPRVTIVIPTCRTRAPDGTSHVENLLASLTTTDWPMDRLTVIVGDDCIERPDWAARTWPFHLDWTSTPRSRDEPFSYARKMNLLWRRARDAQIVLMNDDVEIRDPSWLAALQTFALDRATGGVGAHLVFEDGRVQHVAHVPHGATMTHAWYGQAPQRHGYQQWNGVQRRWPAVTGAVFATRRALLEEVDGFDEAFSLEFNDVDLCLRLRQHGYHIVSAPTAGLIHHEKASRGDMPPPADQRALFHRRWARLIADDPAWHPHLCLEASEVLPEEPDPSWFWFKL